MKQILVVAHYEIERAYLKHQLEKLAFAVDEADNGLLALEMLLMKQYDLIIINVNIEGMDGFRLTQHIRHGELGEQMPILLLSAQTKAGEEERGRQVGANLMSKYPLSPEEIQSLSFLMTGKVYA